MENFFTLQKDYMLRLRKTGNGIRISREKKESRSDREESIADNSERLSGRMTVKGVYNQLSDIRQVFEVTTPAPVPGSIHYKIAGL